jgi:hypothetical protein
LAYGADVAEPNKRKNAGYKPGFSFYPGTIGQYPESFGYVLKACRQRLSAAEMKLLKRLFLS